MKNLEVEKVVAKQMLLDCKEAIDKYEEAKNTAQKAAEHFVEKAMNLMDAFPDPDAIADDDEIGEIAEDIFPKVMALFLDTVKGKF